MKYAKKIQNSFVRIQKKTYTWFINLVFLIQEVLVLKTKNYIFPLTIILAAIFSTGCVSRYSWQYKVLENDSSEENKILFTTLPGTVKVTEDEFIEKGGDKTVTIFSAKGETESEQILLMNPSKNEVTVTISFTDLTGDITGNEKPYLSPRIYETAYVPVNKPTWVSFHKKGNYPDPLIPDSYQFTINPECSKAVYYTLTTNENTTPGIYTGEVNIQATYGEKTETINIPVKAKVFDVILPATSFLKTLFIFRPETYAGKYYGENWTKERTEKLPLEALEFRITSQVDLPLEEVFIQNSDGGYEANWKEFDREVEYWMGKGINTFCLSLFDYGRKIPDDPEKRKYYEITMELTDRHLVEKNWTESFYIYSFDEPLSKDLPGIRDLCRWIHKYGPNLNIIFTMGFTSQGPQWLEDDIDIWVPHIHQYEEDFYPEQQAKGNQVWIYTCMQTFMMRYPDNWKIDWHGTSHRALGWWLFKYKIDGYLYWGLDTWKVNPWLDARTFPMTNGDGSMFYPALDGKGPYYPSIRLFIMKDGIEDYDLLKLLETKVETTALPIDMEEKALDILSCKAVIKSMDRFSTDDEIYREIHREILEILEYDR